MQFQPEEIAVQLHQVYQLNHGDRNKQDKLLIYIVLLLDDASHLLSARPPGQTLTSAEQPIFVQHTSGKKMQPIAMTGCAATVSSHKRKKKYILVKPPGTRC